MSAQLFRIVNSSPEPKFTMHVECWSELMGCPSLPSYEETLFHNARENLRAYRDTLRKKDILFGIFYAVIVTALVLAFCFSL